jgi:xylan 1,4-beta-xylosidase
LSGSNILESAFDSKLITISVMSNQSILDHAHGDIELIYIIKGNLKVKVNNKLLEMKNSDFVVINSNEFHSFQSEEENLFVVMNFNFFQLCSLLNQKQVRFSCQSIEQNSSKDQELRSVIEEVLSLYIKCKMDFDVQFMLKAIDLISTLTRYYLIKKDYLELKDYFSEKSQDERINEIMGFIQSNYREPLTLEKVSSVHYISVPYLSKLFKKHIGTTFSRYLNKVRVAYAVNELVNSKKTITRIALDSGFPTITAFNRVFYELYNMRPVEYRKQYTVSVNNEEVQNTENSNPVKTEVIDKLSQYLNSRVAEHKQPIPVNLGVEETEVVKTDNLEAYTKYWSKLINVGYARDLLNSDMQEQLKLLQNELGFNYARVWGIFGEDMLVEDRSKDDITYNFSNINKVLDFLVKTGFKPFIELGPKPKIISNKIEETLVIQPISKRAIEEWEHLSRAFLLQCIEYFGIDEVENWYFEIWRPNFDLIKKGVDDVQLQDPYHFEEYFKVFSGFKKTAEEIVPAAKVGGCGLSIDVEGDKIDLLLKQWKQEEFQPDFLSVYLFPIEMDRDKKQIPNLQSANPDYIINKLTELRKSLKKAKFHDLELNITEWNITVSNRDYLNDSCFKATYMIKNIIENLNENKVNMIGYWLSSDLFSDFRDSKNFLHGGAGLVTKNGIKKPSYHVYLLLKRLGEILVAKGKNYIVTKKTGDNFQILCYNYKHFDYSYYLIPEGNVGISEQYGIFENNDPFNLSLEIQGIKNGRYRLKELKLDRKHGSVLDEWMKMGQSYDMKQDEVDYLKQICIPNMKIKNFQVKNQTIVLNGELQPHEVRLFEFNLLLNER